MTFISEDQLERELIDQFKGLGYQFVIADTASPDGTTPERSSNGDVVLLDRLKKSAIRLNPRAPEDAIEVAIKKLFTDQLPNLLEENRRVHRLLTEGISVEYYHEDGLLRGDNIWLIDFEKSDNNDWLVLNQFTVVEHGHKRRPDVVVFINGLPLGVIELKNPINEHATISSAFNQLQTYKHEIPSLFHMNTILVISDGLEARIGSLSASEERFMPWRKDADGSEISTQRKHAQEILIEEVFDKKNFLELLRNFTVFGDGPSGLVKIVAGYHQFYAVQKAVKQTLRATGLDSISDSVDGSKNFHESTAIYRLPSAEEHLLGDRRIGVIWHTQGSGKSLLMAFYAGQIIKHPAMENPTIVVITDRNDLDDQLFSTFDMCRDLIRQIPIQANTREDLQKTLDRKVGGVVFSTIQKFLPGKGQTEYPVLTDRRNIVVIADEAHRSQYGLKSKINQDTGETSYGFAKHLRDALPNASFMGFTGTPIEELDVNTPVVFGNYIDVYDINRSIEDKATVPIHYESRLARIDLPDDEKPIIDAEIENIIEDETIADQEKFKRKWATVKALVGAEKRLQMVAKDLVQHFEDRVEVIDGKGMIVCMTRHICVSLYDEIIKLRPQWNSTDDQQGKIKIVMTGSATDPKKWQRHITSKQKQNLMTRRIKDPEDSLFLVIVCHMWLTGFDVPSMHTMYIDKPMRGHGLMQAIARVNRIFKDKPAGLVVDYIGLAQNLQTAISQYSESDQKQIRIDEFEAIQVMLEKYDVVKAIFRGFDYQSALEDSNRDMLVTIAEAIDWVLEYQKKESKNKDSDIDKKRAHRIYQDAVLALTRAFVLVVTSDEAKRIRDEVAFFQAVRAALMKSSTNPIISTDTSNFAIQQIIDESIVSTEIVDILAAVGLDRPDISILSDEFLEEMRKMPKKNLALEALKGIINDELKSRSTSFVVQVKRFSEQLDKAISRYHLNALTTVKVLDELIELAKAIRIAKTQGENEELSEEEISFYDTLADNKNAVEAMGDDKLRLIAQELLRGLKANATIDWQRRESTRAKIRVFVKRALRKHGYPPDIQDETVKTVMQQAEAIADTLAA